MRDLKTPQEYDSAIEDSYSEGSLEDCNARTSYHTAAQTHDDPHEKTECRHCSEFGHPHIYCPNLSQEDWERMMRDSYTNCCKQGLEKEPLPEASYGHLTLEEKLFLILRTFWSHDVVSDIFA